MCSGIHITRKGVEHLSLGPPEEASRFHCIYRARPDAGIPSASTPHTRAPRVRSAAFKPDCQRQSVSHLGKGPRRTSGSTTFSFMYCVLMYQWGQPISRRVRGQGESFRRGRYGERYPSPGFRVTLIDRLVSVRTWGECGDLRLVCATTTTMTGICQPLSDVLRRLTSRDYLIQADDGKLRSRGIVRPPSPSSLFLSYTY